MFDVFDEQLRSLGVASREEAHRSGLWHKTFHCWVTFHDGADAYVVLQRRSLSKDTNPGKLDVSCAGHLMAGESVQDGVRELSEELGLRVSFEELVSLGVTAEKFLDGEIQDFEFGHIFFLHTSWQLLDYSPQLDEISGLYQAKVADLMRLFDETLATLTLAGYRYESDGTMKFETLSVHREDFVSRQREYYVERLGRMLELLSEHETW